MLKLTEKERYKKIQEVFTPIEIVKRLIPNSISIDESTIDIACGTGNILIEVLRKKLARCTNFDDCISAVKSIYGIDFMADNVESCRNKIYDEICIHYPNEMEEKDNNYLIRKIVKNRIQWCDSLVFDYDNWPEIDEKYENVDFTEDKGNNEDFPMWNS